MSFKNILVVDDDKNMTRLLEVVLEQDYSITIAHSINDALQQLETKNFTAAILDLNLNGEDGYSLIKSIRTLSSWLPIIVLSGKEKSDDRIKCFNAGVDDYLTKPFNPDELKARLIRSISKYDAILSQ